MNSERILKILEDQKSLFRTGKTWDLKYRVDQLKKLRRVVEQNKDEIHSALKKDLGKPVYESFVSETMFIINEIDHTLKKIKKWMKSKRVKSPMVHFPAKSYIRPEPKGTVLIIAPWNYPFQLLVSPLIGAIAAGNTAVVKPSEVAGHTSKLLAKLIGDNFSHSEIGVVEGGVEETTLLLDQKFDQL